MLSKLQNRVNYAGNNVKKIILALFTGDDRNVEYSNFNFACVIFIYFIPFFSFFSLF